MSLSLFNAVPAGVIETVSDSDNNPLFKRADLGRFLGIANVAGNYPKIATKSRSQLTREGFGLTEPLGRMKNPQDAFVDLDGALEIVVRSKKPKAVEIAKWLTHKGVEKIIEERQKAIEEKNAQLALLNNDLAESQDLVRQLEFNNVGLQGENRAKDQEIERRMIENADLRERYVPRIEGIDNVLCFIDKKANERHQFYVIRCQRRVLEKHKKCLKNRYPNMIVLDECDDPNAIHRWNRFKHDSVHDFKRNHFNLDGEGRELFETAFDIVV